MMVAGGITAKVASCEWYTRVTPTDTTCLSLNQVVADVQELLLLVLASTTELLLLLLLLLVLRIPRV